MSFISLLFAFLLEQVRPLASGHGLERSFQAWAEWLKNNLDAGDTRHAWTAWLLAVGVPCLLVVAIHWWLMLSVGWVFAMLWSLAVLYATLGFRRFSHHFTGIRDALATGDDVLARELLRDWQGDSDLLISRTEIVRHVIEHSALAAHRHVFGVVAWFSVLAALGLGPVGALFFRLSALLNNDWGEKPQSIDPAETQVSASLRSVSLMAWRRVDWLPARLTGLTFAVVGNFEDAVDAWRQGAENFQNPNDGVVLASTAGAINVRLGGAVSEPDYADPTIDQETNPPTAGREPEFAHLRSMVGLVWRAVVMWMVLLALLTLARLVG
jgi:adenosylcobinamide-phosphate synthase